MNIPGSIVRNIRYVNTIWVIHKITQNIDVDP